MDTITTATLRFERLLDAPVEKVWRYLVDPELRARWFMGGPTELKVGGGWHSHLAVLEKRIKGEAVPDFWALHAQAEQMVEKALA